MASAIIVIAVDNSQECLKAVDFALAHFPKGYTYHLLHVQTHRTISSGFVGNADAALFAYDAQHADDEDRVKSSEKVMQTTFVPRASSAGAEVVATMLHSDPDGSSNIGGAICKYVEKVKPVVLVMMRQNKTAISKIFMGSVSKYCSIHSHVPVLIVPA